jgi:hypothetical protein
MATTHKNEPKSNGKNTVLRPLNIVTRTAGGATAVSATPEQRPLIIRRGRRQVTEAAAKKINAQAEAAQKRANALAERAQRQATLAAEKQAEADRLVQEAADRDRTERERVQREQEERAAMQRDSVSASGSKTVPVVVMTPEIDATIKKMTKDFDRFFGEVEEKYGIKFHFSSTENVPGEPTLVKRGFISARLRGDLPVEKKSISVPTTDLAAQRSELRWMKHYRDVNLPQNWLNKEIHIKEDPNTYIIAGLRGKAHHIVLRNKESGDTFTVPNENFKKMLDKSVA